MEEKETKNLEYLRKLMGQYLNTLRTPKSKKEYYVAEIEFQDYSELGCVIANMIKLCILALDSEAQEISKTIKNPAINVGLILEFVLQLFPVDEFELLSEINELLIEEAN